VAAETWLVAKLSSRATLPSASVVRRRPLFRAPTGTPRILRWGAKSAATPRRFDVARDPSASPAAKPAAVAPTASMGPLALRARVVTESPVSVAFATAPDADDLERDERPEERDDALRDAPLAERGDRLAGASEPELLDLLLLCPFRESDLLLAISQLSLLERRPSGFRYPLSTRITAICRGALGGRS
jgi:hypothetical protein